MSIQLIEENDGEILVVHVGDTSITPKPLKRGRDLTKHNGFDGKRYKMERN